MAIMPQIAMGFQTPQIQLPNQGNMLMQIAQLQQMQEANALRQAQARKLQLDEERGNALAMALQSGQPTLERLMAADPARGADVYKAFQEQQKAGKDADEERRKNFVRGIYASFENPSLQSYGQSVRFLQEQKLTDPQLDKFLGDLMFVDDTTRKQQLGTLLNAIPGGGDYIRKIAAEEAELAKTGMETQRAIAQTDVERARLTGTLPTQPPQQTELARLLAEQKQFPSGTPEFQAYQKAIENYRRGVTIETPVPVVDPSTGQVTYATRQEAIGKTPPQFMEGLTPRERQQREAKFPAAKAAVAAFDQKADKLDNLIEQFVNHPGVNQITGLIGGRIVGITDEGRAAEALYNTIMAQGGFSELQAMRDASTSGGALGSVSNQENQFLRDAFGVTKRTQSTADLIKGFKDVQSTLRSSKLRVRQAFEDTYAYRPEFTQPAPVTPSGGPAAAPAAPAQPSTGAPIQLPKDNADAVYNSLPSGAQFIDPNGVLRRKP